MCAMVEYYKNMVEMFVYMPFHHVWGRTDNICWVCFSNEAFRWMVLNIHISHTGRDIAMVQLGGRSGLGDNPLSVCSLSLF